MKCPDCEGDAFEFFGTPDRDKFVELFGDHPCGMDALWRCITCGSVLLEKITVCKVQDPGALLKDDD